MIAQLKDDIKYNAENTFNKNNNIIHILNDLITENNLIYENDFPFIFEKQYNELSFLNNKKIFNIIKVNKKKNSHKIKDNNLYNISNFNKKNKIDYNVYKIEKNSFVEINKSYPQKNKINNSFINEENNEEINQSINYSIKKNNKMIFINKNLIKKKIKNNDFKEFKKRRSVYRGVSKNGKQWQTIITHKGIGKYVGLYRTQEIAARVYDIISIKNKGIKAQTNFKYNVIQIQKISEAIIDFKSKNIEEIISNLIKY